MNTRTGDLYESLELAKAAGVPDEHLVQVEADVEGEVVTITSGPFKGRQYVRNADGSLGRRVRELASAR